MMDIAVTKLEASKWFHVDVDVVRTWVRRYGIAPVGRQRGADVFRLVDLIHAEHRARTARAGRPRTPQP